jgi:hypothetical protein
VAVATLDFMSDADAIGLLLCISIGVILGVLLGDM